MECQAWVEAKLIARGELEVPLLRSQQRGAQEQEGERSKVRIRSVAPTLDRRYIQFSSDGFVQLRLTLRVSVCDGHRHIDTRRVRRCCRVNLDQGGLVDESG